MPSRGLDGRDGSEAIARMEVFVKEHMKAYDPSHDWPHVDRVRNMALKIARTLHGVDMHVVELAALMHDLNDSKYSTTVALEQIANQVFTGLASPSADQLDLILRIIPNVSYSKEMKMRAAGTWGDFQDSCLELHAVQDADRLDAIGAVGVLRTAAFSGVRGRELLGDHDPKDPSCVGHFYDKLFKIREFMKTEAGRKEAETRHKTMVGLIEALKAEERWM